MIKQRLFRKTRFQWGRGSDDACRSLWARNKDTSSFSRSCCTLLDIRSVQPPRYWRRDGRLVNDIYYNTKNVDEQTSDNIEEHL